MYKNWSALINPKGIDFDSEKLSATYGKFEIAPLERGFGTTIGNSLRRILLSSLQGAAITGVKIDGVKHEFSTIKGVSEDVAEIILNLKEVRLLCHSEGPEKIEIHADKSGVIKAKDIITNDNVEILNPEHHIATVNENGKLHIEMMVKMGKGYVPAEENKEAGQSIDTLPVDAIFTPIVTPKMRTVEIDGKSLAFADACRMFGISTAAAFARIKAGASEYDAVTKPLTKRRKLNS